MKKLVSEIAVSFFFSSLLVLIFHLFLEPTISKYIMLFNSLSIKESVTKEKVQYDLDTKRLIHYPSYGEKYATIKIPSINLSLAVYHGDNQKILMLGVGHYTGSYFPGENGTILYAGHNNEGYLNNLDKVIVDDLIIINTNYGDFYYQVYNKKVVNETDLSAFKVQNVKEELIIYTCYPIDRNIVGRKIERLVLYAMRVDNENTT